MYKYITCDLTGSPYLGRSYRFYVMGNGNFAHIAMLKATIQAFCLKDAIRAVRKCVGKGPKLKLIEVVDLWNLPVEIVQIYP